MDFARHHTQTGGASPDDDGRLPDPAQKPERKSPRPHQSEAIKDILKVLDKPGKDVRTNCVMACGTGKTLVGLWASEKLGNRTLLAEPSLALIAQNLKEWKASYRGPKPEILVVCSDQTTVKINSDEPIISRDDIGASVTNNVGEIAAFLKNRDSRKILISTLHSMPLVSKAMEQRGVTAFDCTVVDEAHRTATREQSVFSLVLDPQAIASRTRLFLTATPKLFISEQNRDGERVVSMDDENSYGPRSHTLSFSNAINQGLLTDYQLVVAAISEREAGIVRKVAKSEHDFKYAVAELALLRAAKKYDLSKVVTFHGTVRRAHDLADRFEYSAKRFLPGHRIWVHAIDGKMPTLTRNHLVQVFREQPRKTLSVMANCQCLKEGVDVPALDCVTFFDKRESEIDIVQAVGRAMRLSPDKKLGTILIPVVVPDGEDPDTLLSSSEFQRVWQVVRALKALDDGFETRCKALVGGKPKGGNTGKDSGIVLDIESLPATLKEKLTTRVVNTGTGTLKTLLFEETILKWCDHHFKKTGSYPDQYSGTVLAAPEENWTAINAALRVGSRGLSGGSSLVQLLQTSGRAISTEYTIDKITSWGRSYLARTGKLPNAATGKIEELPVRTWGAIDAALRVGSKGLPKIGGLSQLWENAGLKADLKTASFLSVKDILLWADEEKHTTGRYPTKRGGKVSSKPDETWPRIDDYFRNESRGLTGYRSLAHFLSAHGRSNPNGRPY